VDYPQGPFDSVHGAFLAELAGDFRPKIRGQEHARIKVSCERPKEIPGASACRKTDADQE
jgi:hypothetical protein